MSKFSHDANDDDTATAASDARAMTIPRLFL